MGVHLRLVHGAADDDGRLVQLGRGPDRQHRDVEVAPRLLADQRAPPLHEFFDAGDLRGGGEGHVDADGRVDGGGEPVERHHVERLGRDGGVDELDALAEDLVAGTLEVEREVRGGELGSCRLQCGPEGVQRGDPAGVARCLGDDHGQVVRVDAVRVGDVGDLLAEIGGDHRVDPQGNVGDRLGQFEVRRDRVDGLDLSAAVDESEASADRVVRDDDDWTELRRQFALEGCVVRAHSRVDGAYRVACRFLVGRGGSRGRRRGGGGRLASEERCRPDGRRGTQKSSTCCHAPSSAFCGE